MEGVYYMKIITGEELVTEIVHEDSKKYILLLNPFVIVFNAFDNRFIARRYMPMSSNKYQKISPIHVISIEEADRYLLDYYDMCLEKADMIEQEPNVGSNTEGITLH